MYYLQSVQNMSIYKRRGSGWQTKSIENLLIIWNFRVSYLTHQDFKCFPPHWVWITWRCQDRNSKIKFPKISEFCGLCGISQVFFLKVKNTEKFPPPWILTNTQIRYKPINFSMHSTTEVRIFILPLHSNYSNLIVLSTQKSLRWHLL